MRVKQVYFDHKYIHSNHIHSVWQICGICEGKKCHQRVHSLVRRQFNEADKSGHLGKKKKKVATGYCYFRSTEEASHQGRQPKWKINMHILNKRTQILHVYDTNF